MTRHSAALLRLSAAIALLVLALAGQPAHAAPFSLRSITDPRAAYSTLGNIAISFEIIDDATGLRVNTNTTTVKLDLMRCFPISPCTANVVTLDYATAQTVNGVATFNMPAPATANQSYYFIARTTIGGISSFSTTQFNVFNAVVTLTNLSVPQLSTMSQYSLTAQVRIGSAVAGIDTTTTPTAVSFVQRRQCTNPPTCSTFSPWGNAYTFESFANGVATASTISFSAPGTYQLRVLLERGTVSVTSDPTNPFAVTLAALSFTPFTTPQTTASRVNVTVNIFDQAGGAGQLDVRADTAPLTLSVRQCTNFVFNTCLDSTHIADLRTDNAQDGVITFNDVNVPAGTNLIFRVVNADANRSAQVGETVRFSTDEAYLIVAPDRTALFVGQPLDYFIEVRSVDTDAIDTTADNIGIVLRLRRCNGFISNNCATWTDIDNSFASGSIQNGLATLPTSFNSPNTQLYVLPLLDVPYSFIDFNYYLTVYANNSVRPSFTYQGRPAPNSPLLVLPIRVILTPTSGGAARDVIALSGTDGTIQIITNVIPGTYTVTIKQASALARQVTGVVVTAPGTINVPMGEFKPGDVNNDNTINLADFTAFAATFSKTSGQPGYNELADFNGDSAVNLTDFTLLSANFGTSGAPLP